MQATMAITSSLSLLLLLLLLAFLHSSAAAAQGNSTNISALETAVRDRAFELLRRTNQLVAILLPVDVSAGVEATALRIRSNTLWADGIANATATATAGFSVPPRVVPAPFARRVDVVFERFLGESSGALFAAPRGYALAAPVVALLAYDAAGHMGSRVALRALGAPVRVEFGNLSSATGFNATTARCLTFAGASGKAIVTHAMVSGTGSTACAVSGTGHYGVAVRVETPPPPPAGVRERWWVWTAGVGTAGLVGVSFLAVSVAGVVRWNRRRRREELERLAMAGEELGRMAVRGSRMPSAKMVRTRPELEVGSPLPWRS